MREIKNFIWLSASRFYVCKNQNHQMKNLLSIGVVCLLLSSCTMTMPVSSSGPVTGPKTGTASAQVILGLSFNGDASIEKAANAAGITKVGTVSIKQLNVLGIYQKYTTTVTGE